MDTFWKLPEDNKIGSQDEFYAHLKKSDHLKNTIYEPETLGKEIPTQTTRISNKTFEFVSFSRTQVKDIIFRNCTFRNCLLIGSKIVNCEFHDCNFVSTNTHKFNVSNTYIDPESFKRCLKKDHHQNIGVHLYQILLKNSRESEQIEFERDAQFNFMRWKRYQNSFELSKLKKKYGIFSVLFMSKLMIFCRRMLWEKLFGSGIRIRYFFATISYVIVSFSILNFIYKNDFGLLHNDKPVSTFSETLYFTIISLTTLGYGDVVPTTKLGLYLASVQSVVGFCLFAILASMLYRRISP